MPINKVIYGNEPLIDLTEDTVTPETLLKGITAHKADGTKITGILEPSTSGFIGDMPVGSIVWINVDGVPKDFLIVHQGLPSDIYDESCDGTWLWSNRLLTRMSFAESNCNYKDSLIHKYLNEEWIYTLDEHVQNVIKDVKIPYSEGTSAKDLFVVSGKDGLPCKSFLISTIETCARITSAFEEGVELDYFSVNNAGLRVRCDDKQAIIWWTRTVSNTAFYPITIIQTGSTNSYAAKSTYGVLPMIILQPDTRVDFKGNILPN